jgi:hypothetical protein
MSASAVSRTPEARCARIGLCLAAAALFGQLIIAVPHAAQHPASGVAPLAPTVAHAAAEIAAPDRNGPPPHDPAHCPICQAAAVARGSMKSQAVAEPVAAPSTTRATFAPEYAYLPATVTDPSTPPRAPPV